MKIFTILFLLFLSTISYAQTENNDSSYFKTDQPNADLKTSEIMEHKELKVIDSTSNIRLNEVTKINDCVGDSSSSLNCKVYHDTTITTVIETTTKKYIQTTERIEKKLNSPKLVFSKLQPVNDFSSLEENFIAFTHDPLEYKNQQNDPKTDNRYFPFLSFKVSTKFPIFRTRTRMFESFLFQTFLGYTGEYDFHINRYSHPIISSRQNPSVRFMCRRDVEGQQSAYFREFYVSFEHESNGQVVEDEEMYNTYTYKDDILSIGWNFISLSGNVYERYVNTRHYFRLSSELRLYQPERRGDKLGLSTYDNFDFVEKSHNADFSEYRTLKLDFEYSFSEEPGHVWRFGYRGWYGLPSDNWLSKTNHRLELAKEVKSLPLFMAINFGSSKYLANYWETENTVVVEFGIKMIENFWEKWGYKPN